MPGEMRTLIGLLLIGLVGCNRHDTEAIARIGRKITAHAKTTTEEVTGKLDIRWAARREPSLQEKILERLRWENTLTDVSFEVMVNEKEVELKGTVHSPLHRQRAIELAETVVGVEKVIAKIEVRE